MDPETRQKIVDGLNEVSALLTQAADKLARLAQFIDEGEEPVAPEEPAAS